MKRKIIKIDEDLCNGCANCVTGCSEGALQIIDGKAKLVKENFCDGFGDCIGTCPTGALTIEERKAEEFDVEAVKNHLKETQGEEAVIKMEEAQKKHHSNDNHKHHGGGCPGSRAMNFEKKNTKPVNTNTGPVQAIPSELTQWPVQLHLVPVNAPYFHNKEMVVMSTCSPVASADMHWRYLRGRSVVIACPKLDKTENYVEKMAAIFRENEIPKIIVTRMEVPCCMGLTMMVKEAIEKSGKNIALEEQVIGLQGELKEIR